MNLGITFSGMSGFLGSNLNEVLIKNNIILDSNLLFGRKDCDLLNYEDVLSHLGKYPPQVLVHTAGAVGGITFNMAKPADLMLQNLRMGMNIIEAACSVGVKRIIMLGTVCSYGREPGNRDGFNQGFKESQIFDSKPDYSNRGYGVAKLALMELLCSMERQYGIKHTTIIATNMYGKYDDFSDESSHVIPALIKRAINCKENKEKKMICYGTGLATRDLMWAPDCCEAIVKCLQNDKCSDVLNIGTGIETSVKVLSEKICEITGFDGELEFDTSKSDGQPRRVLDCTLAKEQLGWEPKMMLDEGLRRTVSWYLENGELYGA